MKELSFVRMRLIICVVLVVFISGCASTGVKDERDPIEGFNRTMYSFNQGMDKVLFNPIAKFYQLITPDFVERGISNIFNNIDDISIIANDILQLKIGQAYMDTARFLVNSTLGLAGFLDVSSQMGLEKHDEDFGQTLAVWGVGAGPYIVVPIFGSTTLRDSTSLIVDDMLLNPVSYLNNNDALKAGILTLNFIDIKADLLTTNDLINEAALDQYEFTKNAYFSRRESQINDGRLEPLPDF
ncbi:MAG: VacJ family lipoprotein [Gammaproteobacteria bacterium]|nr:MAG: VacJ family lipoprotein [Gammaproteobacteria bacterium]RKZ71331.1 MAG: VacJ family lipoprotein [Gammaproteobacteria bacterium]RLA13580.1 MAG: VacJ family lipoprotein [Gammaproteobacteria bacterium]